jgi:hypothetical protein
MSLRRRWAVLGILGLACMTALVVYLVRGDIFDPLNRGRSPVSGEFVEQSRTAIEAKCGPPSAEWEGHYGNPPNEYTREHDPALSVTCRRGAGTLFLSFERRNGEWVCFSSDWMPCSLRY